MARSDVKTDGMLNRWPIVMTENPFNYNQILGVGTETRGCPVYVQSDRDDIAYALHDALSDMAQHLGYWPVPRWFTGERIPLRGGYPYYRQPLQMKFGHLIAFGTRATSLIQAGVTVTYTDSHSDGILDTATITVTTDVDIDEIGVFFRVTDGAPSAANERWQIDNVYMVDNGGTVTITGHRALFVKPNEVWDNPKEDPNYNKAFAGNNGEPNHFVTAVDIYRVYADTTGQAGLVFYDDCGQAYDQDSGIMQIEDADLGFFSIRANACRGRNYVYADVNYYAGKALVDQRPDPLFERAVVRLANTYQTDAEYLCCFCDRVSNRFQEDQKKAEVLNNESTLASLFGNKRGQINAARFVRRYALGQGGKLTA